MRHPPHPLSLSRPLSTFSPPPSPLTKVDAFFAPGKPVGELPFDPTAVREHALKMRAALYSYYEGDAVLTGAFAPDAQSSAKHTASGATEAENYKIAAQAMADHFSRVFIERSTDPAREKQVAMAFFGDSVTAGQDNCFFDAWPVQLQRQLAPLFAAAGLEFEVRLHAFNGGYDVSHEGAFGVRRTHADSLCARALCSEAVASLPLTRCSDASGALLFPSSLPSHRLLFTVTFYANHAYNLTRSP